MYNDESLEVGMASMKKGRTPTGHNRSDVNDRDTFPPEAFDYGDELTKEGIEQVRKKAAEDLKDEEWELVDGFGHPDAY